MRSSSISIEPHREGEVGRTDHLGHSRLGAKAQAEPKVVTEWLEPSPAQAEREQRFQFERHGYFVADRVDHDPSLPVFNRITALKDGWGK